MTDAPLALDPINICLLVNLPWLPSRPLEYPANFSMVFLVLYSIPNPQVIQGGSAARAGLQRGDVILEVNGNSVGGLNDLEMLQQLTEAEPPLCLKLVPGFHRAWKHGFPQGL